MDRSQELLDKVNRGIGLTLVELTELVGLSGCKLSRARLWQIEQAALRKLRRRKAMLEVLSES